MAETKCGEDYSGYLITNTPTIVGQKFHQVKIDRVTNGFIIEIGCKKFVHTDWDKLAKKLGEYWKDPVAAEKKYCQ